jgi:hypothetical protein
MVTTTAENSSSQCDWCCPSVELISGERILYRPSGQRIGIDLSSGTWGVAQNSCRMQEYFGPDFSKMAGAATFGPFQHYHSRPPPDKEATVSADPLELYWIAFCTRFGGFPCKLIPPHSKLLRTWGVTTSWASNLSHSAHSGPWKLTFCLMRWRSHPIVALWTFPSILSIHSLDWTQTRSSWSSFAQVASLDDGFLPFPYSQSLTTTCGSHRYTTPIICVLHHLLNHARR